MMKPQRHFANAKTDTWTVSWRAASQGPALNFVLQVELKLGSPFSTRLLAKTMYKMRRRIKRAAVREEPSPPKSLLLSNFEMQPRLSLAT